MTGAFKMQTQDGHAWSLDDPQPFAVHWPDVAAALAKICRFGGHVQAGFYSVAQHCCVVCDALPVDMRLYGLLHDAHEAYLGDWIRPLKGLLAERLQAAILEMADLRALITERRDLLAPAKQSIEWPQADPFPYRIKPWPWTRAADEWLGRLEQYGTYTRGMEN